MKITQIPKYSNYISKFDLANMFNVYEKTAEDGQKYMAYNINRGLTITGVKDIPPLYIDYYEVKENENLNLISYKIYGTIELWWIIAKINNIKDATISLKSGQQLYILKEDAVNSILAALNT